MSETLSPYFYLRSLIMARTGATSEQVDYMSHRDILLMHVNGKSNNKIVEALEIDLAQIESIILHYTHIFPGYLNDLVVSPYALWQSSGSDKEKFVRLCKTFGIDGSVFKLCAYVERMEKTYDG